MLGDALRRFKRARRITAARADLAARLAAPPAAAAHGLDGPLVVSLTSYPDRFATLSETLAGLMTQSVRPDATILWLARDDIDLLPDAVTGLRRLGLEIAATDDLRSYKKLIPALAAHPEATIVTADDDVFYHRTWLAELVAARRQGQGAVLCHRAHRIVTDPAGRPAPYADWSHNIATPERSALIFPTGVCGVLYAPGMLHPEVTRADLFQALCPDADDIWFYWMHRLTGGTAAKIGGRARIVEWPGSQQIALRSTNLGANGNDRAIAAMLARYGFAG